MKAIETEYAGYRFRSRLEARWAVFFDTADIEFQYEAEGFTLPNRYGGMFRYLPDFWFPGLAMYGEVKADWSVREKHKFLDAVNALDTPFLVLPDIFRQPRGGSRRPWKVCFAGRDAGHAEPWPPMHSDGLISEDPAKIDLLRGFKDTDTPAPELYVAAARAAQRARFEFGESPGRPTL